MNCLQWFGVGVVAVYVVAGVVAWRERRVKRAIASKMGLECLFGNPPQVVEPRNPPFSVARGEKHAKISNG